MENNTVDKQMEIIKEALPCMPDLMKGKVLGAAEMILDMMKEGKKDGTAENICV